MSGPLTPAQEQAVRAIVAEMIGQALGGADARLRADALKDNAARHRRSFLGTLADD